MSSDNEIERLGREADALRVQVEALTLPPSFHRIAAEAALAAVLWLLTIGAFWFDWWLGIRFNQAAQLVFAPVLFGLVLAAMHGSSD